MIDRGQNRIAFTDFGMARRDDDDMQAKIISPIPVRWCSPELCALPVISQPADIYALGKMCDHFPYFWHITFSLRYGFTDGL